MNIYEKFLLYVVIIAVAFLSYLQYANSSDIQQTANAYNVGYKKCVSEIEQTILKDLQDGEITFGKDKYKKVTE